MCRFSRRRLTRPSGILYILISQQRNHFPTSDSPPVNNCDSFQASFAFQCGDVSKRDHSITLADAMSGDFGSEVQHDWSTYPWLAAWLAWAVRDRRFDSVTPLYPLCKITYGVLQGTDAPFIVIESKVNFQAWSVFTSWVCRYNFYRCLYLPSLSSLNLQL